MKYFIFLLFFASVSIFSVAVDGMGVGIIPDRLEFSGKEEMFRIVNPNKADIGFEIKSDKLLCVPVEGKIIPKNSLNIICTPKDDASGEDIIIVETNLLEKGDSIGVLPAVAVKATIYGQEKKENSPLMINSTSKAAILVQEGWRAGFDDIKTEIATIVILLVAIIGVLVYPEIVKTREKLKINQKNKKTSNDFHDASSISIVQDDQSSASTEASPDQLLITLSRAWKAQNQQPSPPERYS